MNMLSVVGIGPGALDLLTERARARHPHRLHYSVHRSQMISHLEKRVAGRVVFANADPSFLDLLVFRHHPVETGIRCIKNGMVITDIEMVKAGINKRYSKEHSVL